ncbi:hypothetical protein [Actinoplanes regularis]|uniref:hypothetical protein n=1 Tax=Actinoplanes regularis TaxID=52697 RepID=UPI0025556A85|nr:hypothetical protein [Actinoplanes regularis]
MRVNARSATGEWRRWRIGRRRLAWRPSSTPLEALGLLDLEVIGLILLLPFLAWWLATWIAALLATTVVWPMRAISGRWTVVAYDLDSSNDIEPVYCSVPDRETADATVRRWVAEIQRHGRLPQELTVPALG